jgi:putative PEP-CTERM system TPR-repeat lipoprotein
MKCTTLSAPGPWAALALACTLALSGCGGDSPKSLIASGKEYTAKKDHKAAAIQFKSALQGDPQSAEARYLLGQALLSSGDPSGAVLELSKLLDQKYDPNLAVPALARAMLLTGQYKKLATLYGEMTLTDKLAQASLKSSVATAWGAQGDKAKTEAAIAAALQAAPDFGPAQILNARILAGKREFEPALALVETILAKDASLYEAWHLKGEILAFAKNDNKGAEEAFRKALEAERAYVPAHLAIIGGRLRARDVPGAKAQADALRALMPKHPQTIYVDAQIAFTERDLPKARDLVQLLLKGAPNHTGVLQLAGAVEGQAGSLVMAETYFSKALQLVPELPLARRNLAQTYLRLDQAAKALETLQPLLAGTVQDADAHALAGDVQLRMGNAAAAEGHFTQAVKIKPDNMRVKTAMALTHLNKGDPATAFAELETIATQSPEDTFADQAIVSARLKRREFDAALQAVDVMLKKNPGNATALEMRGRVQVTRKDYVAAREAFEQALKVDPGLFSSVASLAGIDVQEKKFDQAKARLDAAIKTDPRNHYAYLALAEVRRRAGASHDEITKILSEAIKVAPSDATARLQLIEQTLSKRQYKEALVVAQEAAAALPNDLRVLDAVGRAQMEAGDVEQAVSTFRRIAGVDQKSAMPYVRLADVYKSSGKRPAAETALRKALEIEPGSQAAQESLMNLMLATGRTREVLELARNMQQQHPKAVNGYAFEALVQIRLKSVDTAMAAFKRGLAVPGIDPELARLYLASLARADRAAEAERFGVAWMKDHPEDTAFDYQMATNAIARNDLEQAETRLRRVVVKRPRHPLALNNLAWVLAVQNKPGGVEFAQRAVALMPDKGALVDTLAMALAAEKQFDKALSTQKRAVELSPDDNGLRLNLARIALQAGDKALARTELDRLQALGPGFAFRDEVVKLAKSL